MSTPRFDTLGNLRKRLATRLGFGAQADVIALQLPMLDDFLQSAQTYLWRAVSWRHLQKVVSEPLGVGQRVMDLPDDADISSIKRVWVRDGTVWQEIGAGIPLRDEVTGRPCRFELLAHEEGVLQLHFYPTPNELVDVKVEYEAVPASFTASTDRASLPDDLIFFHALINAKAHYRQPDVQAVSGQYEQSLRAAREANFGVDDSRSFGSSKEVRDAHDYVR